MPIWVNYVYVCDVCTQEVKSRFIPDGWVVDIALKSAVTCLDCRIKAKEKELDELREIKERIANE